MVLSKPIAEDPARQDRLGGSPFDHREDDQYQHADRQDGDARHGRPTPQHAAFEQSQDHQGGADRQQGSASEVDAVPLALHLLVESSEKHPTGDRAERHVDEEDPSPVEKVDEKPAESWADDGRDRPHTGDVPLHSGPLGYRIDVTDDRHRRRLDRTCAESLQRPESDQRRHAPGKSTQDRSHDENTDTNEHDRLAAHLVTELAEDRNRHSLGQQIDREQPWELGETTEIIDDRRDRCGQNGRVDGHEAHAEHHRQQDRPSLRT